MTDTAITIQNVSKYYKVYENQIARWRHSIQPSYQNGVSQVWALRDVNFEVQRGESFAVIGRNGSGKSTLLEIITQTLTPTAGKVQVNGRIAALLELGSGFNPEYTGRENIFLNGLLLGLTRAQIENRFDDIAAFADIGDVLDRQVKTYSSGMLVRLAFAVQIALEPNILIVDEALSVGDYFFQQKCFGRLRKMREEGLTLLFVSHDMGVVRDLCGRAAYLHEGKIGYVGDSKVAIRQYLSIDTTINSKIAIDNVIKSKPQSLNSAVLQQRLIEFKAGSFWQTTDSQRSIQAVRILGADGPVTSVRMGDTVKIQVLFQTLPSEYGHIGLTLKNRLDQIVANVGSHRCGLDVYAGEAMKLSIFEVDVSIMLEAGQYSLCASFGRIIGKNVGSPIDVGEWFGPLLVTWNYDEDRAPFLGMFGLPVKGRYADIEEIF